jgi:hypothetical protein
LVYYRERGEAQRIWTNRVVVDEANYSIISIVNVGEKVGLYPFDTRREEVQASISGRPIGEIGELFNLWFSA